MKLSAIWRAIANVRNVLTEAAQGDENNPLAHALRDFAALVDREEFPWALGGGLAVGQYLQQRPRPTYDVDVFVTDEATWKTLQRRIAASSTLFKRIRGHALEHRPTGVEVEVLTPEFLELDPHLAKKAIEQAVDHKGFPVLTPAAIVALKLQRGDFRDLDDIQRLALEAGVMRDDVAKFGVRRKQLALFDEVIAKASRAPHDPLV